MKLVQFTDSNRRKVFVSVQNITGLVEAGTGQTIIQTTGNQITIMRGIEDVIKEINEVINPKLEVPSTKKVEK